MTAALLRLLRDRFPGVVALVQVPPAIAVVLLFGVEHPYYQLFPALLLAGGLAFLHPAFVSGRARFVPPLFYFGLISLLSSAYTRTSRPVEGNLFHPAEYFFLALLSAWAISRTPGRRPLQTGAMVLALCALAAGLDEWHQAFVPGRVADPVDWLLDLLGALAGCACFSAMPGPVRALPPPVEAPIERIHT